MLEKSIALIVISIAIGLVFLFSKGAITKEKIRLTNLLGLLENVKWKITGGPFPAGGLRPIASATFKGRRIEIEPSYNSNKLIVRCWPKNIPKQVSSLSFRIKWPRISENCDLVGSEVVGAWDLSIFQNQSIPLEDCKRILNEILEACLKVESGNYNL